MHLLSAVDSNITTHMLIQKQHTPKSNELNIMATIGEKEVTGDRANYTITCTTPNIKSSTVTVEMGDKKSTVDMWKAKPIFKINYPELVDEGGELIRRAESKMFSSINLGRVIAPRGFQPSSMGDSVNIGASAIPNPKNEKFKFDAVPLADWLVGLLTAIDDAIFANLAANNKSFGLPESDNKEILMHLIGQTYRRVLATSKAGEHVIYCTSGSEYKDKDGVVREIKTPFKGFQLADGKPNMVPMPRSCYQDKYIAGSCTIKLGDVKHCNKKCGVKCYINSFIVYGQQDSLVDESQQEDVDDAIESGLIEFIDPNSICGEESGSDDLGSKPLPVE